MAVCDPARLRAWSRSRAVSGREKKKVRSARNQRRANVEEHCSSRIEIPTVKRDNEIDGAVGGPFLDFADVGGQGRLVHGAMKDLASGRHGGTENECR